MRFFVVAFVVLLSWNCVYSQSSNKIGIGENIPNVVMTDILNFESPSVSIADFKGRVLILDFWSRGCGGCIASFPKIEALNSKYEGNAIVVPVTMDSRLQFEKLRTRSRIIKESKLPFVINDTVLHSYFPHRYVPYCAWIDERGRYIGASLIITEEMIDSVIMQGKLTVAAPAQIPMSRLPVRKNFEDAISHLQKKEYKGNPYYSKLFRMSPDEFDSIKDDFTSLKDSASGKLIGRIFNGKSIMELITYSYGVTNRDMYFETKDLARELLGPKYRVDRTGKGNWIRNNAIFYQCVSFPDKDENSWSLTRELLKKDLREYFGIEGEFREMKRACYVLRRKSTCENFTFSPQDTTRDPVYEITKHGLFIDNWSIVQLVNGLSERLNSSRLHDIPVFNETGYDGRVSMYLKVADMSSMDEWNKALNKFGLEIVRVKRKLNTLVVKRN